MLTDHDLLIRMDEKLDTLIEKQADHEVRLRILEGLKGKIIGMAVVASLVLGFVLDTVKKKVFGA